MLENMDGGQITALVLLVIVAVWVVGTLPATFIAAKVSKDWTEEESTFHMDDRVAGFVACWPFVIIGKVSSAVVWFVGRPFVWLYRYVWRVGRGDSDA